MQKEYILKQSPLLKIVLRKKEFEIINHQYSKESGFFSYSKLYDIEFREKSTDYVTTGFIFLLSIILPGGRSRLMKFNERIRMNYNGKERKIILFDYDRKVVAEVISEIQKQIDPKYLTVRKS